jgi:hypothetical protein
MDVKDNGEDCNDKLCMAKKISDFYFLSIFFIYF